MFFQREIRDRNLKTGTTTVGLVVKDGVALATDTRVTSGYFVAHRKGKKLFPLADYAAITIAGRVADAQTLIDVLKANLGYYMSSWGRPMPIATAARLAANFMFRSRYFPYVAQLIIAGVDESGPHMFNVDLLGSLTEETLISTGSGSPVAYGILESEYDPEMSVEEAVIEFEGPRIAIYTRNPEVFANQDQVAKDLVNLIKKRVVIRSDESIRLSKKDVEEKIKKSISGVQELIFNDLLGEVVVELDPNAPQPDDTEIKLLSAETSWVIRVERQPPMQTKTIEHVKKVIYGDPQYRLQALRKIGEKVFRNQVFETTDAVITILGSGRQVGRSAILLQTSESKVLLDCGYSPSGSRNLEMFPRLDLIENLVEELDAVIVTHAHLDHMGMVPYLFKYDYRGPVYCTEPTLPLMLMQQLDFINVAGKEGVFPPYTESDVRLAVQHTIPMKYGVVTNITPDIRITFYNAGHILGSSIIHIHIGEGFHNVIYTGDFKFENSRTLDASAFKFPRAETLIMESTYGATPVPFTRSVQRKATEEGREAR